MLSSCNPYGLSCADDLRRHIPNWETDACMYLMGPAALQCCAALDILEHALALMTETHSSRRAHQTAPLQVRTLTCKAGQLTSLQPVAARTLLLPTQGLCVAGQHCSLLSHRVLCRRHMPGTACHSQAPQHCQSPLVALKAVLLTSLGSSTMSSSSGAYEYTSAP